MATIAVTPLVIGGLARTPEGATVLPIDVIPRWPGPHNQEFNATIVGGTTLGTLDVASLTNFPGLFEIQRTAGAWCVDGRYWPTPAIPFTLTAKLSDHNITGAYQHVGIMILEATPGKIATFGPAWESGVTIDRQLWTNRTTRASNNANLVMARSYLRFVVASATSVAHYASMGCYAWGASVLTGDPGFTPANWGVFVLDYNGAVTKATFDWVRFVTGSPGQTWNGTAWV